MKKLLDAGLLDREQRGVWAYYSLRDDANRRLSAILNLRRRRTMTELRERPGRGSMIGEHRGYSHRTTLGHRC
jgi:DNA-binding transcriptional ArsR family regulator